MKLNQITTKDDYRFLVRDSDPSNRGDADVSVISEAFDENVYQIHEGDFNDTNIFIDIGANIGAVTLYVESLNQAYHRGDKSKITVYAIEPEVNNLEILKANLTANEHNRYTTEVIEAAVTADGRYVNMSNEGGNAHITESSKNKKKGFVRSIKFDDLFDELGIDGCDVMKIDIEGAEYECLLSASLETLRKIQYIAIEFDGGHDEFGQLVTKLAEVFNLHILGMPSKGGYIYGKRY